MDKSKEILDYLNLHINRLWTGILVLLGGLSGLLITYSYSLSISSSENIIKLFLFLIGAFLLILMLIGLANTSLDIKKRLK